ARGQPAGSVHRWTWVVPGMLRSWAGTRAGAKWAGIPALLSPSSVSWGIRASGSGDAVVRSWHERTYTPTPATDPAFSGPAPGSVRTEGTRRERSGRLGGHQVGTDRRQHRGGAALAGSSRGDPPGAQSECLREFLPP